MSLLFAITIRIILLAGIIVFHLVVLNHWAGRCIFIEPTLLQPVVINRINIANKGKDNANKLKGFSES